LIILNFVALLELQILVDIVIVVHWRIYSIYLLRKKKSGKHSKESIVSEAFRKLILMCSLSAVDYSERRSRRNPYSTTIISQYLVSQSKTHPK
jgi:hypothetical protein